MKLGSVTVGGVFKGILVEVEHCSEILVLVIHSTSTQVEYCPGVVPNNCWGILLEFMQVGQRSEKKT